MKKYKTIPKADTALFDKIVAETPEHIKEEVRKEIEGEWTTVETDSEIMRVSPSGMFSIGQQK